MEKVTMNNVNRVAHSDKPKENYHRALQFPSAIQSPLVSLGSLFWFHGQQTLMYIPAQTQTAD